MKNKKVASILKRAEEISKAVEAETEEILEDAEMAVKQTAPACSTAKVLSLIEKKLEAEGIEALFQKSVSKIAMKKTASEALSEKEIEELADVIVEAIVEEMEDVLKDAEEVCDEDEMPEVEGRLKSILERKLANKGIYAKFARKHVAKKVVKKNVVKSAKEVMAKNRASRNK